MPCGGNDLWGRFDSGGCTLNANAKCLKAVDTFRTFERWGAEPLPAHWEADVDTVEQAQEIRGSKADLERRLGVPIDMFAYPFGRPENLSERNREVVKAAGLTCCFSGFGGLVDHSSSVYELRRIPISQWFRTPSQFVFEMLQSRRTQIPLEGLK